MAENLFDRVGVAQLECHFKCFEELNCKFGGQWLSSLLSKQLHYDMKCTVNVGDNLEGHDEDGNDLPVPADAKETLVYKNFVEAYRLSTELWDFEKVFKHSQPQVHLDTWTYVVLAIQLNILKEWRSSEECTVNDDQLVEIVTRIESLQTVVNCDEAKAFVSIMKRNLSRDMQNPQLRIDFAKAIKLNPKCPAWYLSLYLAMRHLRRSTGCCESSPSRMEIDACEKAYELASVEHADNDDLKIGYTVQMAKLYAELLFNCRRSEHQYITASAIKFARDVVQLSSESKSLKMRLVTLLTGGRIYKRHDGDLDQYIDEVRQFVQDCEVGRCSSEICHKLAKFYSHPRLVGFDADTAKALEWLERGLEAHIGNFPCFADMLKNPNFRLKPTSEILQKINTVLSSQSKPTFRAQLHFIKGFFLWPDAMDASLQSFLTAMKECADLEINFVGLATLNYCFTKYRNCEKALEVVSRMKFFMCRKEMPDPEFAKFKEIINAISKHFEQRLRQNVQYRPNVRNYAQQRN